MVSLIAVLAVANSLRSVDGKNEEYDRALVELTTSLIPFDQDVARDLVEAIVLEKRPAVSLTEPVAPPIPMTRHAARAAAAS